MAEIVTNVLKIIILGDPNVGKTSLRLRYLGKGFKKQYIATIGADFAVADYNQFRLQIWDLAGDHQFKSFVKPMFTGAEGLVVVFDITDEQSMKNIPSWIDMFRTVENRKIPILIVGNKIDLKSSVPFPVKTDQANKFVMELGKKYDSDINYIETSALTGENIVDAFENLVDRIIPLVDY